MGNDTTTLFYDPLSGKYFTSTVNHIYAAVNKINYDYLNGLYSHYIDMLDALRCRLGLPSVSNCGYYIKRPRHMLLNVNFETAIGSTEEPCLIVDYCVKTEPFRSIKKDSA